MFKAITKQSYVKSIVLLLCVLFAFAATIGSAVSRTNVRTTRNNQTQSVLSDAYYNTCRGVCVTAVQTFDAVFKGASQGARSLLGQAPPSSIYIPAQTQVIAVLSSIWTVIVILLVKRPKQKTAAEWLN